MNNPAATTPQPSSKFRYDLLALSRESGVGEAELPTAQLEWLRALAQGITVAQLAERHGYSERAMFRHLRDLYARMGAKGRTEALMLANRRGWL
jgi:DNA-binding NarL/FixJ family response regulator